jgi:hypothetical protein
MARSPNDPIGSLLDVLTPAEKAQIPWINMPPGYGPQGGIPTDQSYRVAGDIPDANRNGQVPAINMPPEYGPSGGIQPLYQPPDVGGIRQMQQNVTGGIGKFLGIPDAIAALRGQMTPDEAQMFALGALPGLLPGARGEQAAAEAAPAVARGIRAFHGSPYDFPAFDISKIGTGEGAQAYGHGLYFAENPKVAAEYRTNLDQPYQWDEARQVNALLPKQNQGSMDNARQIIENIRSAVRSGEIKDPSEYLANYDVGKEYKSAYQKAADIVGTKSHMYEVNINADPEHFLDWDKPLSEQGQKVKDFLAGPMFERNVNEESGWGKLSGEQFYNAVGQRVAGSKQDTTEALRQAGIPGIKYLDQGSRSYFQVEPHEFLNGEQGFKVNGPKGDVTFDTKAEAQKFADNLNKGKSAPTYNYVVFDDKLIDIIKKYGIAGLIGAGASNWSPSDQK